MANDTNAHEMWQKLSGLYERKNALNRTSLMRKIVNLKYRDGESIVEHINTFMGYVNQLAAIKFPLDDAMQAIMLMCTLPESWENLVVTLNTSCQEEKQSVQTVKTSVLNEEVRRKDKGVMSQTESNLTQHMDRGRDRRRRSPQRTDKSHARSKSRGKPVCFYCGKPGHFQKDCRHLKKDKSVGNKVEPRKIPDDKNTSAIATSNEELLFICEQTSVNLASGECTWVIDSGASYHITPSREYFSTYIAGDHGYVKMGDSGECKITGVRSVCLTTSTRCRLTLS